MVSRLIFLLLVLWSIFVASPAFSQSEFSFDQGKVALKVASYEDNRINAYMAFDLEPGWKIYWRQAGDSGIATSFSLIKSENITKIRPSWPVPTRYREEIEQFVSESYVYEDRVHFPLILTAADPAKEVFAAVQVDFAVCKDICLSQMAVLEMVVPFGFSDVQAVNAFERALTEVPVTANDEFTEWGFSNDKKRFYVNVKTDQTLFDPDLFIEGGDDYAFYQPEMRRDKTTGILQFMFPAQQLVLHEDLVESELTFTLVDKNLKISDTKPVMFFKGQPIVAPLVTQGPVSWWWMLFLALLGGFILNVMPCVLPVLSIKIMSVIQHSDASKSEIRKRFLITSLGIVSSFLILALGVEFMRSLGQNVGWGFHFQEPVFLIFLIVVLTLFAANMWGLMSFHLPQKLQNKLASASGKQGALGDFLTGAFATLLATPCSAPFLGTALAFALSGETQRILLIFGAMGIGLSLPYLLIALFPGLVSFMPKPGKWMVLVKHFMGYLLAITAIWLIWVLSAQLGQMAVMMLCVLLLLKLFKLWLSRYVPLLQQFHVKSFLLGIIVMLAFILPVQMKVQEGRQAAQEETLSWNVLDEAMINDFVAHGKIVFVDVTADWCLTCKMNKFFVLTDDDIETLLADKNIVLMRGDWTNKDPEIERFITKYGRVGIPFNAVFAPNFSTPLILPELLTDKVVKEAIAKAKE